MCVLSSSSVDGSSLDGEVSCRMLNIFANMSCMALYRVFEQSVHQNNETNEPSNEAYEQKSVLKQASVSS